MILTGIALQNFRLHKNYFLKFTNETTVIIGNNAVGKTSIVEAVNLLATGNSFRAGKVEEMVEFESDLARVKGVIVDTSGEKSANRNEENNSSKTTAKVSTVNAPTDEVEIILTRGIVNGKRTQHRLFSVNGVRRRKKDATGKFFTVSFRPEDMRMIEGLSSRRRAFLDTVLSLLFLEYEVALKNYEQTLIRRNKLIQQIKDARQPRTVLQYWDLNLVKYGEILQKFRQQFLESFASVEFPLDFSVEYDPSLISAERLAQYKDREILAGHTLIGPHKDDIILFLNSWREHGVKTKVDNEVAKTQREPKQPKLRLDTFGSRGQQRLGVLWLKFCELEYLKNQSKVSTVLLLDDILSELDDESKTLALSVLKKYQSIVTTTEPSVLAEIEQATDNIQVINL